MLLTPVQRVNVQLLGWTNRCMSGAAVQMPLQRMVALAPRSPACVDAVALPLAIALRMDSPFVLNVTRRFAAASLQIVMNSLVEARQLAPHTYVDDPALLAWPGRSSLQPSECDGGLI